MTGAGLGETAGLAVAVLGESFEVMFARTCLSTKVSLAKTRVSEAIKTGCAEVAVKLAVETSVEVVLPSAGELLPLRGVAKAVLPLSTGAAVLPTVSGEPGARVYCA